MLQQLLFRNQDKKQLIIAIVGSFLGITFLVTSIHYLVKVNEFGRGTEILGPNTLIVQKRVNSGAVLGMARTDFSESEIENMKKEKFISDVKPVLSNNFDVSFQTDDPHVPYFRSDVFIQTVDPAFLDVKSDKWHWQQGDSIVPIILPRDFLVMLNTFMSASGIPQVSDDLAKEIQFKFTIRNNDKKEFIGARIIGFTNEVASILVPQSFMEYGNTYFALGADKKITQIMISGEENEFGLVEQYLTKHGLESKNSQMVVGRLKSIISTLILVILGISVIAVFVSCLVLIQYLQLLMSRNAYEVRTLIRMGYHPKLIVRTFFVYFIKIFGIITVFGFAVFFGFKLILDGVFSDGGLALSTGVSLYGVLSLLVAYVLFAVASYRTAKKGVFKEYFS
ncbi:MAG: hypothetical protein KF704_09955 [Crocinitomicaceae bacterium]|nr:hypothetical protein [Crocinitomicaceae bacterium]NGF76922.1 hypothetical protein [Fluviicola sp. SGL-29]